jgi:hypothetical protein
MTDGVPPQATAYCPQCGRCRQLVRIMGQHTSYDEYVDDPQYCAAHGKKRVVRHDLPAFARRIRAVGSCGHDRISVVVTLNAIGIMREAMANR